MFLIMFIFIIMVAFLSLTISSISVGVSEFQVQMYELQQEENIFIDENYKIGEKEIKRTTLKEIKSCIKEFVLKKKISKEIESI